MRSFFLLLSFAPIFAAAPTTLKSEYLFELDITSQEIVALAEAVPAEKYSWRPADGVRSVGEVYIHIAEANVLLLGMGGIKVPEADFSGPRYSGKELASDVVRRNLEFEKTIAGKERVVAMLRRTIDVVKTSFTDASDADLEEPADFFGRKTTVRALYLRILAHMNEHMGQSIAYARMNGVVPPWSK